MAEDETGEVPKLPPDARLELLDQRLDRLQQAEAKRTKDAQADPNMRIAQPSLAISSAAPSAAACSAGGWTACSGQSPG